MFVTMVTRNMIYSGHSSDNSYLSLSNGFKCIQTFPLFITNDANRSVSVILF